MEDSSTTLFNKYVPRWIRVIRWREWGQRITRKQKGLTAFVYLPAWVTYECGIGDNSMAWKLFFLRPQTEEELILLKRNNLANPCHRSWEYDQYDQNIPPLYDMSERRLKYPQYYKGRYDGYKKDTYTEQGLNSTKPSFAQKFVTV